MRITRFLLVLIFTVAIVFVLDRKIGQLPPVGRFLDPFHGFWQNAEKKDDTVLLHKSIPLLKEAVSVRYDEHFIPHIFAKNEHDLYLAQGFVTAQNRLWQMEFQTLAAAGRVSEIIGKAAIKYDRTQRRKGMLFAANNAVRAMEANDTASALLQSYAEGVNAYINSLKYKDLPIEYKLLDYKPEKWTPLKTALLLKYMSEDLSGWDADLENTNALRLLGKETFDFLFPDYMEGIDPIIPEGTTWDFEPVEVQAPDDKEDYPFSYISKTIEKPNPRNGSNNWAVSANKTANENPILANDPHLGINLPSIWFTLQLHSPEVNVMGASLPGAPGIIVGFNENIAWGVTNATRDVRDWYHIEFRDKERLEYRFENRWLRTQRTIEEIKVRNGSTVYDTVIYTHHGPVVYDRTFPGNGDTKLARKNNFALKWTAHEESVELLTFHFLNRATNYDDYVNALQFFHNPGQNFAFASVDGNIALWIQGKYPAKWEGQGRFLMDGSDPLHEWQAYIPQEHNAHIRNPERGFVSSANQHPVDENYPYYVYDSNYEFYRNRRINSVLSENDSLTIKDIMRLQNDDYNLKAAEILPLLMENVALENISSREKEIFDLMKEWNFFNEIHMKAPSVFEVWWDRLYHTLWDEFESDTLALMKPTSWRTIQVLRDHPDHEFMDDQNTSHKETADDLILNAFTFAVDSVDRWATEKEKDFTWGNFKGTSAQHLLRQNAFSVENIQVGGNKNIVNANGSRHGVSWRMIVELGPQVRAWGVYPGGQSGNPGSRYYDNFIEKWAAGEYLELLFMRNMRDGEEHISFTQELHREVIQ